MTALQDRSSATGNSGDALVRFTQVKKSYDGIQYVVKDLNLDVAKGEFLTMLGPSGSGKTTTLMMLGGFERPTLGHILLDGKPVERLPPEKRNIGFVFQNYALFPHMTVAENVAFPLRYRGIKGDAAREKVKRALGRVSLEAMGDRKPAQLSGGQQQRVALARALAPRPHVLLLDEPLSALDAKVRRTLRSEIRKLQQELGITTIMVTHDQEEALTMADHVVVMNEGRIIQQGPPAQIYDRPLTPFVAGFVGSMNFLTAVETGEGRFRFAGHELVVDRSCVMAPLKGNAIIAIRPEDVQIARPGAETAHQSGSNTLEASVEWIEFLGGKCLLTLAPSSSQPLTINAEVPARTVHDLKLSVGSSISLSLPPNAFNVYPA